MLVPQFARRWRTVSFFREEGMEAKHHEVNGINRVLACMRKEEDRLANCLRRVEVRQTQKAGDLAVAVPRNFNAQGKQKVLKTYKNPLKTNNNHHQYPQLTRMYQQCTMILIWNQKIAFLW